MLENRILITNGIVVNETNLQSIDILIEGQRIVSTGLPGSLQELRADEIIDAHGKYILPGLIDPHVHFNAPFMGSKTIHDYENGTIAAAYGGVTTIIDFSTQPKGGSLLENLALKESEASGKAYIDWSIHGILLDASQQTLKEIPMLIEEGIPTYKCFTTYRHADRLMDDDGLLRILEVTAENGGMLMVHCENDAILEYYLKKELNAGHYAPVYHARSRPHSAENEAIRRIVALMDEICAPIYIVHTSTAESVGIIQRARERKLPIHSETCTHYLTLTEEVLNKDNGLFFICSPPLRKQKDITALWQAVSNGRIEVVSSDDAGLPSQDRLRLGADRFDKVPSGMPGIEPRLYILYTEGVCKGKIDLPRLVQLTSANPARLFGLFPQKGHINPGSDADLVIFDPHPEWTISANNLHMNDTFCPFEGWSIKGKVESVICRGQFVIRNEILVGKPGFGQRIIRRLSQ